MRPILCAADRVALWHLGGPDAHLEWQRDFSTGGWTLVAMDPSGGYRNVSTDTRNQSITGRSLRCAAEPVFSVPTEVVYHHRQDPIHEDAGHQGWSVEQLVHSMANEGVKDPVTILHDGDYGYLEDGNHRVLAADQAGIPNMPVRLRRVPYVGGDEQAKPLHPYLKKLVA